MVKETLYDFNRNKQVGGADLPSDLSPDIIDAFCEANGYSFSSIYTPVKNEYDTALNPERFRVARLDDPSQGVTIAYDLVREWLYRVENTSEADVAAVRGLLSDAKLRAQQDKLWSVVFSIEKAIEKLDLEAGALAAGKARLRQS